MEDDIRKFFIIGTLITVFSLTVLSAGNALADGPLFDTMINYDVGDGPFSVIIVDLDGDDDNDIVAANMYSNNVSLLFNEGDGTFQDAVSYDVGKHPASVFSIDLDGDGDNDLAVANLDLHYGNCTVSILLNNGDGTFQAAVNYGVGDHPKSVFSIDLDGDDDNDLVTANLGSDDFSVLLNNGNGTFQTAINYSVGRGMESIFSIDLDGDGDSDLAIPDGYHNGNVLVLLNNGDGTFQPTVRYAVGVAPLSVFSIDLDGDSENDLAVANSCLASEHKDYSVSVLLGNGDGTFQPAVNYDVGSYPVSIFSIDFDQDGDNDIVTANSGGNNVSILLNNGDGSFQTAIGFGTESWPNDVSSNDLDGDGDCDLAVANFGSNSISVLFNRSVDNPTGVREVHASELPTSSHLSQNYPNPFNPITNIEFALPRSSNVLVEVVNVLGQNVRTLVNQELSVGHYVVTWDGTSATGAPVASGVYFYRIKTEDYIESKKMVLMK